MLRTLKDNFQTQFIVSIWTQLISILNLVFSAYTSPFFR
jgi:hypothetical protein